MNKFKALLIRFIQFVKVLVTPVSSVFIAFTDLNKLRRERLHRNLTDNATWSASIRRFEKEVELEEVKFAFEQAEKLLKDSVEDSQKIVSRINIVMTICGGALIFLGGDIAGMLTNQNVSHFKNFNTVDFLNAHISFFPACLLAIVFLCILLRLATHLGTVDYFAVGSQPKQLFVRQYYEEDNSEVPTIIKMYLGEIEDYQLRITENEAKNQKRWFELRMLIKLGVVATIYAGIILLAGLFLSF